MDGERCQLEVIRWVRSVLLRKEMVLEMAKANMTLWPGLASLADMQGEMVVVGACSGCCRLVERRPYAGPG
jgi:hypothetical protein